jgi:hypothetical protein
VSKPGIILGVKLEDAWLSSSITIEKLNTVNEIIPPIRAPNTCLALSFPLTNRTSMLLARESLVNGISKYTIPIERKKKNKLMMAGKKAMLETIFW